MVALQIALIGTGSMGANHARVISEAPGAHLELVIDEDLKRAQRFAARYGCRAAERWEQSSECDAVVIATTTQSHAAIAMPLIELERPLLIEKPVSTSLAEVQAIVARAEEHSLAISCGFVERFNPVVIAAQGMMSGTLRHILATRHSPPTPRARTSVVHDLLIHDIDLAQRFSGSPMTHMSGLAWTSPAGTEEIADCLIGFDSGAQAALSASRASQRKTRTLTVVTDEWLYELDLLRTTLTMWQHIEHAIQRDGSYRAQTVMEVPFVRQRGEPLALQFQHFLALVRGEIDAAAERAAILPPHIAADAVRHPADVHR